jgi:hypothetical protein
MLLNSQKIVCDICGSEDIGDFTITMEYGSEDDCFGASGDEYDLCQEYGRDFVLQYLTQGTYHICHMCDGFMRQFENDARAARVKNIAAWINNGMIVMKDDKEENQSVTRMLTSLAQKYPALYDDSDFCQSLAKVKQIELGSFSFS